MANGRFKRKLTAILSATAAEVAWMLFFRPDRKRMVNGGRTNSATRTMNGKGELK